MSVWNAQHKDGTPCSDVDFLKAQRALGLTYEEWAANGNWSHEEICAILDDPYAGPSR